MTRLSSVVVVKAQGARELSMFQEWAVQLTRAVNSTSCCTLIIPKFSHSYIPGPLSPLYTVFEIGQNRSMKGKVEEKGENFSLRKLRNPGEREREKYSAPFFEISHIKRENFSLTKTEKTWRKRKRKGSATFLLHLDQRRC
jgi:hypothetical protein